jgi:hypothetical protein
MGIIPGEVAVSWAKIIRKYNWPDTLEKDIQKACEEYARNLSDYKAMQLAEKDAEIERLKKAVSDAQQESFFVREYLDEARDWFRQIMEEAEDCPNTIEEWRDGLCSGSVGVVVNFCKAAMSEIPEGGDVVFLVRQRIEDADVWQSPRGRGGVNVNEYEQDEPNDDDEIIITYKKFNEMSGHVETLKSVIANQKAKNARMLELLKVSLDYINMPHKCLLAQAISEALAGGEE